MKKFKLFLLAFFIYFFTCNNSYAQTNLNEINISARQLDQRFVEGEINPKILKNYNIIKLEIQNKSNQIILLPSTIFYTTKKGQKCRAETPQLIFKKLKRNPAIIATIITIPVTIVSLCLLTVPAFASSYVYGLNYNTKLEANIKRNSYHSTTIADSNTYEIYVLIPKKYKQLDKLLLENIKVADSPPFTLETDIGKEDY